LELGAPAVIGTHPMKGVKKQNLPTKICVVCARPFAWRKKWERCWEEVLHCSDACRRKRTPGR
jgi:hypothetical protein